MSGWRDGYKKQMGRWVEGGGNDETERKGRVGCGWMDGKMPFLSCCDYYNGYYCVGRRGGCIDG